ncbi:trehalose synthase [Spirosoma taeanense]|uniref:Alpha-amylase n=1 Tax=Spirosoma taeanense TaxID=2735870 RepID=A0A6M5Y4U6_9BACT|nr:alpha-amylase family protein [Spirosoma taeanense]QJW89537.1 trehalose synthase [Spirosoma taeanense]
MQKLILILCAGLLLQCQQHSATEKPLPADFKTELWYKHSLIYNLDVEVFKDSDGDGIGDFQGLVQQLDYLKNLGVDVIWLSPFQPTPNRDDGYDVADFYGIDTRLGTRADFDEFMRQARQRGIRVIMDMVVNHTSDQHHWFQQARRSKNSPYHSWYVWSDKQPDNWDVGMVFPGVQKEIWSYDKQAGAYFYHRFYNFQPDLNAQNPAVQREIRKILKHWLDAGVSGFRLDAVPFMIEIADPEKKDYKPQFEIIDMLHKYIQWQRGDAIVLGEANVAPEDQKDYFGEDDKGMQMMFNFYANQYLFYALATGQLQPFIDAMKATKDIPSAAQWAIFLRNHDEIDLGRLSDKQREEVYARFGPQKNMQLYDRGIRRRLAPMLGDPRQIRFAYSLLFSLPGTPVIRYGEEIGMGDDLRLKESESVRTPMQWTNAPNAGFTTGSKPVKPVISQGEYGYPNVNVATESQDSTSLLNFISDLIHLRKQCPEIGLGTSTILDTGNPNVLAIRYDWQGQSLAMVHNFSTQTQQLQLPLAGKSDKRLVNLLEKTEVRAGPGGAYPLSLPGYGYQWYRMKL